MPYITPSARTKFEKPISIIADALFEPGELNYVVTKLCREYVRRYGESYSSLNEVIGVLECAKMEYYRRTLVPYEDAKLAKNGDIE